MYLSIHVLSHVYGRATLLISSLRTAYNLIREFRNGLDAMTQINITVRLVSSNTYQAEVSEAPSQFAPTENGLRKDYTTSMDLAPSQPLVVVG